MAETLWILERTGNKRFPYRLCITGEGGTLLRLLVQEKWPGQKGNVFCLRDDDGEYGGPDVEIERVPVLSLQRFGKRLSVILDRSINKRCDFLFLTKQYKNRDGEYEQIFWRTERGLRERKPKVKLSTYNRDALSIVIDSSERYAWGFPDDEVSRERLPVGDYALKGEHRIVALVERKTFDNLLQEFGRMHIFHQQLSELDAYLHSALVIEANYSDFLNPQKMKYYPPAFAAQAIAELYALHPALTILFAGNRKLAREWCRRFFSAIAAHEKDRPHRKISEVIADYGTPPEGGGGSFYALKQTIEDNFHHRFTVADLRDAFPDVPKGTVQRALRRMKADGVIEAVGRGKNSYWQKCS